MDIRDNLQQIRSQIPSGVRLVCVSKFHPAEAIQTAYDCSERAFGESRAQELTAKHAVLPADIEWHFIGSLQTNKVKQVVPLATLIHSVDSEHLLAAIDQCAASNDLIANILLEIHIAQETTKHGFLPDEARAFIDEQCWLQYPHTRLCGLMTMGTADASETETRREFHRMRSLFDELKTACALPHFTELSMGMSHDFRIAIDEGSTIVRIGTAIFGERTPQDS